MIIDVLHSFITLALSLCKVLIVAPNQGPPAMRVDWISGHRPEKQKHVNAYGVTAVIVSMALGLKNTIHKIHNSI